MVRRTVLDFRGEECPGPLVRTLRRLAEAEAGDVLIVYTDVEECVRMIKEAVEEMGLGRVEVVDSGAYKELHITRGNGGE